MGFDTKTRSIRFVSKQESLSLSQSIKWIKKLRNQTELNKLTEFELTPEVGWRYQYCHISALKGDGVDELLEAVASGEMMDLRANARS